MILLARLGDERVQTGRIVVVPLEDLLGQARLKELAAGQPRHDVSDPSFAGDVCGQGVDRLEATVADVREPFQAVDEDLVHMRRASPVVIHAE
ncbi:MAG: hypothetical protein E5W72_07580 [Mesorhizobium sp.]|nr:MAG: hypothetical protein E5W72_07580 [Mesorhizobium sp.]